MHSMKKEPRAGPGDLVAVAAALFRARLEIDHAGVRRVSRNRNRFTHLDTLAAALAKRLRVKGAILDGEIICADETGRPIFIEMLRGRHPVCFVAVQWRRWRHARCARRAAADRRRRRARRHARGRGRRVGFAIGAGR
jgi:hypothetical protein